MESKELNDRHWVEKYCWAFYYAIETMTTVGYGDISPTNIFEAGLLIILMVTSSVTFAVTFNTIGTIIQDIYKNRTEL